MIIGIDIIVAEHLFYLFTYRYGNLAITRTTCCHAMHAPLPGDRYERRVQGAFNFHAHAVKLQRYQRRRLALTEHVRLVAPNVRILHLLRIRYHRVAHRRRREVSFRRLRKGPRHRRRRRRSRSFAVVYSLREVESEFNGTGEIVGHRSRRRGV